MDHSVAENEAASALFALADAALGAAPGSSSSASSSSSVSPPASGSAAPQTRPILQPSMRQLKQQEKQQASYATTTQNPQRSPQQRVGALVAAASSSSATDYDLNPRDALLPPTPPRPGAIQAPGKRNSGSSTTPSLADAWAYRTDREMRDGAASDYSGGGYDYPPISPIRGQRGTPGSPNDTASPSSAGSYATTESPQRYQPYQRGETPGYISDNAYGDSTLPRGRNRNSRIYREPSLSVASTNGGGEDDDEYFSSNNRGSPSARSIDDFRSNYSPSISGDFEAMDIVSNQDSGGYRRRGTRRRNSVSSDDGSTTGHPPLPRHGTDEYPYNRSPRVPPKISRSASSRSAAGARRTHDGKPYPAAIRSQSAHGFPRNSSLHIPEIVISSPRSPKGRNFPAGGLSAHPPLTQSQLPPMLPAPSSCAVFPSSLPVHMRSTAGAAASRRGRSHSVESGVSAAAAAGGRAVGRTRSATPGPYSRDLARTARAGRSPSRSKSPEPAAELLYRQKRILSRKRIPGDRFDPTAGIEIGGYELANYTFFDDRKTARVPDLDVEAARRLQEYRDSLRAIQDAASKGDPLAAEMAEQVALTHQFTDLASLVISSGGAAEIRRRDAKPALRKGGDLLGAMGAMIVSPLSPASAPSTPLTPGEVDTVFIADPELDLQIRRARRAVWSEGDKETFEMALTKHGRNFWLVSLEFGNQHPGKKSVADCVEYYYLNKFQLKWLKRHNYEKKVNAEFNQFREDVLSTSTTINKMVAKLKYERARAAEEKRRSYSQPPSSRYGVNNKSSPSIATGDLASAFKPSPLGVYVDRDSNSSPSVLSEQLQSVTPPPPPLSLAGVIPTNNGVVPILEVPVNATGTVLTTTTSGEESVGGSFNEDDDDLEEDMMMVDDPLSSDVSSVARADDLPPATFYGYADNRVGGTGVRYVVPPTRTATSAGSGSVSGSGNFGSSAEDSAGLGEPETPGTTVSPGSTTE